MLSKGGDSGVLIGDYIIGLFFYEKGELVYQVQSINQLFLQPSIWAALISFSLF